MNSLKKEEWELVKSSEDGFQILFPEPPKVSTEGLSENLNTKTFEVWTSLRARRFRVTVTHILEYSGEQSEFLQLILKNIIGGHSDVEDFLAIDLEKVPSLQFEYSIVKTLPALNFRFIARKDFLIKGIIILKDRFTFYTAFAMEPIDMERDADKFLTSFKIIK